MSKIVALHHAGFAGGLPLGESDLVAILAGPLNDDALDHLESLAADSPAIALAVARDALLAMPLPADMTAASEVFRLLRVAGGDSADEWLLGVWPTLDERQRTTVCYAAHGRDAMPFALAERLFAHPASTTRDRHLIAAGVAARATGPGEFHAARRLVEQIGVYGEPAADARLAAFVANVRSVQG